MCKLVGVFDFDLLTVNVSCKRFLSAVFPIFDFKKCRNLEVWIRGDSRSLKVVPFDRLRMVSY